MGRMRGRPRKAAQAPTNATGQLPLSEEEKRDLSGKLATLVGNIEDIECQARADAAVHRRTLKPLREERTLIARQIRNGYRELDPQLAIPGTEDD